MSTLGLYIHECVHYTDFSICFDLRMLFERITIISINIIRSFNECTHKTKAKVSLENKLKIITL